MWVDDVNAKGGLLGRKVEFIAYDDQSNPANTPGIYTKLLDVDKVDLLIAPYATVPTAPIMPLVKQRGKLLMGNFSFQVNAKIKHDMWFNNAPWNDADGWSDVAVFVRADGSESEPFLVYEPRRPNCYVQYPKMISPSWVWDDPVRRLGRGRDWAVVDAVEPASGVCGGGRQPPPRGARVRAAGGGEIVRQRMRLAVKR